MISSTLSSRLTRIILLAVAAVLVLIYISALLFDPSQIGLVIWPRDTQIDPMRLLPVAIVVLLHLALAHWIYQQVDDATSRRKIIVFLAGLFLSACVLQVAATSVPEPFPLRGILHRQYSQFTSGWFTVGSRVENAADFLAEFAQRMPSFPVHPSHHPPGLPLLFWAGTRLASLFPGLAAAIAPELRPLACFDERAAQLNDAQIASGLIGAGFELIVATLVIVPLFMLVKRLSNTRAALLAASLYPLTACVLMWVGRFDHAYPFLAVCGLLLCEHIVASPQRSRLFSLILGAWLGLATFFTFGNFQIILVCAVYFIARALQREGWSMWRARLAHGLLMVAAFAGFWLFWVLIFQFDLLGTYRYATDQHWTLDRPYWPWVAWQPWDIFTFIGLPISLIALVTMWKRQPALAIAFIGPIVLMAALHIMRDETGRTGMFFAPLAVGLTAMYLERQPPFARMAVIGLNVAQVVVMIALLRVTSYGIDPATVADATLPTDMTPIEARFDINGEMRLLGYQTPDTLHPGESSFVVWYWKLDSTVPLSTSYKTFFHVADSIDDQMRIVNQDSKPMEWGLPTTCWRPGMVVRDLVIFRVDPNAPPGDYVLLVGLYDEYTNQRAFVHTAQIARNGAVMLPIQIHVVR